MNKAAKTYHTPATALTGQPELAGALYYGRVYGKLSSELHEVAVIKEDGDEVLVAGPTLLGWRRRSEVLVDED